MLKQIVVRASALQFCRSGFDSFVDSFQKIRLFTDYHAWYLRDQISKFVCCVLGRTLNGRPLPLSS